MADPVTAEIAPLFGTGAAPPTGQAAALPGGEQQADTQGSGENKPVGETPQASPTAVAIVPTQQTAVTTTNAKALPEDYYTLQACTVVVTMQFYPVSQQGQPRRVLLSIQNGAGNRADLPLLAVVNEDELGGPLPPALVALWQRLEADLPRRKQRQAERDAKATVAKTITAPKQKAAKDAQKSATPPPPPTTATPIQKGELAMGGLFDDM